MDFAHAVIYKSPDGKNNWTPILPEDVPEFVRRPETMGRLMAGEMCMDTKDDSLIISLTPKRHTAWYRAEPFKAS